MNIKLHYQKLHNVLNLKDRITDKQVATLHNFSKPSSSFPPILTAADRPIEILERYAHHTLFGKSDNVE